MKLIHSVEVRYFRSLHTLRLDSLGDCTIFSGKNDSGKSNILRALNLFFNSETEWRTPLDFGRDINYKRLGEVRKKSVKGKQFISVRIVFNRGDQFVNSLPPRFSVTRKWQRDSAQYEQYDDIESQIKRGLIDIPPKYAKRSLNQFLNRIKYVYIPAIKDVRVFQHVTDELERTLYEASSEKFNDMMKGVASSITDQVAALISEFEAATGIKSRVRPPTTPEGLLKLSIDTEYETDKDYSVQLDLRGDGIRTRYIPSILYHIAENSKKSFIWGFEEPENSLEYGRAVEMANDFVNKFSKNSQILLTTHSPAFISQRTSPKVEAFRIYMDDGATEVLPLNGDGVEEATQDVRLLHELGVLRLQEELHQRLVEARDTYLDAERTLSELRRDMTRPQVLTEGKTDVAILKCAWKKLHPDVELPWRIEPSDNNPNSSGGAGGATKLQITLEGVRSNFPHVVIGLFDRDTAGISGFKKLSKNFKVVPGDPNVMVHENGRAIAILLPVPTGKEQFANVQNLPIEYYFPEHAVRARTTDGKGLILEAEPFEKKWRGMIVSTETPAELWYHTVKAGKEVFANEIVPTRPEIEFEAFGPLFDLIEKYAK